MVFPWLDLRVDAVKLRRGILRYKIEWKIGFDQLSNHIPAPKTAPIWTARRFDFRVDASGGRSFGRWGDFL